MTSRRDSDPPIDDDSTVTVADKRLVRPLGRLTEPAANQANEPTDVLVGVDLPLRFEAKRLLGSGGMGVVVEAHDRNLGRDVAVKLLASDKRDPVHRVRFRREAKAAAMLRHPNVVTVYDVDTERDFIVMELVRGESLRARLQREGALPSAKVRGIGVALLAALAAAHDAGIVHRDVKPANILFDEAGVVKLVDFGVASFGDRDLTSTGMRIGTPAYMAPEQLRGRVADVRADIYAIGATLFEMATGVQLHAEARSPERVKAAVVEATGDAVLAAAIARAVAQLPEDRFASARELAEALGGAHHPPTSGVLAARRWWWLAIAGIVVVGGAAVAVAAFRDRGGDDGAPADHAARTDARDAAHRTIAVLPFTDRTLEPRLDFAASGLAHILATELRTIPDLQVISYYELLDRLPGPDAPPADWRAAASSLGAEVVVHGELTADAAGIRIVVQIESIAGGALGRVGRFEQMATVDTVPEVTRAIAADAARGALGRSIVSGEARTFDVDRHLQLGISALARQDFTAADEYLNKVELQAPDLAEAQYHRAVLNWWLSRDVAGPSVRALAGRLDPAQRGFMEGLRLVQNQSHLTPAIDYFQNLVQRFPDHRDILYGLFEALYHGGAPAEAMVVYRRLGERHPRFRLGLKHALSYYIGHAQEDGMRWVIARLEPTQEDAVLWQARALFARRDYTKAIALLRRHETKDAAAKLILHKELVGAYLVDGQLGMAQDLAGDLAEDMLHNASARLAVSTARGQVTEEMSESAANAASLATGMDQRERGWLELAAVELPEANPARLRRILKGLGPNGIINQAIARVLVAGALGDRTIVDGDRTSEFPEVAAIADAYRAEWAKDGRRAADAWARAAAQAADGNFLIVEHLGIARVARSAGDHAAVLRACDEVIRPRRFTWAWGGAVGPCLRWSAEAATALGRPAEARASWERLLDLRSKAPARDVLAMAARAGLAALGVAAPPRP